MNANVQLSPPEAAPQSGAVIDVPLNRLKKSPRNVRRAPHSQAAIEALAASIAAKGVLQAPVVEPEIDEVGAATGFWLVTIGEGRRLALCLRAQRKEIRKTEPVRVVVDLTNDPQEISLDENVTRSAMHPADQFEAFRDLNERKGWGPEEIGARFGVSAQLVRQRLRLGAVSRKLMAIYREDGLTLDQLMAFAVSEDHARQEQVLEQYGAERPPYAIRRLMTETKVSAQDRRAVFVGAEAYQAAGGAILRDLFTEDGGGWFEDAGLLDGLAFETLSAMAEDVRAAEGWKWAEAHIDYPHALGLARVYPHPVERSADEAAEMQALGEEYDALVSQHDGTEEWPVEVEARLTEIALAPFGDGSAFDPDDIARGGVFLILGQDGAARIERGLVRPEDLPPPAPEPEIEGDRPRSAAHDPAASDEDAEGDVSAPLPDRLVLDLTAHRTAALRDRLGADATRALTAVTHALALSTFYPGYSRASCLELKAVATALEPHAPGIEDSRAGRSLDARHARWASRLPQSPDEVWPVLMALPPSELLELLAHCASLTLNAVRVPWERKAEAQAHADRLAEAVELDMTAYWSATAASYLGRVTKARIAEAVGEAVSADAAARISGCKKPEMAAEAEALLAGKGWLPAVLRAPAAHAGPDVTIPSQDDA